MWMDPMLQFQFSTKQPSLWNIKELKYLFLQVILKQTCVMVLVVLIQVYLCFSWEMLWPWHEALPLTLYIKQTKITILIIFIIQLQSWQFSAGLLLVAQLGQPSRRLEQSAALVLHQDSQTHRWKGKCDLCVLLISERRKMEIKGVFIGPISQLRFRLGFNVITHENLV